MPMWIFIFAMIFAAFWYDARVASLGAQHDGRGAVRAAQLR
jgi:hypothetical protein